MSRQESAYQIYYSYLSHRLFGVLTGRIDKLMTFLLLLLGSSVMASVGNPTIIGLIIAAIAAAQTAFKPAATSEASRIQSIKYLNLFSKIDSLNDENLAYQIAEIQTCDCSAWESIESIAEYRTDMIMKGETKIKLSPLQSSIGKFC